MGYRPGRRQPACPACCEWAPVHQYRTVDVITGRAVRAVRCACGRTFDRDRDRPLPRVRDGGPVFDEPSVMLDHITAMARPIGGTMVAFVPPRGAQRDPHDPGCWLVPQGRHAPPLRVDRHGRPTVGQLVFG